MVRLTDRPDMTSAVYRGCKTTKQQHTVQSSLVRGILKAPKLKIHAFEIANSVDPDKVAQKEPPRLDLCCLLCFY